MNLIALFPPSRGCQSLAGASVAVLLACALLSHSPTASAGTVPASTTPAPLPARAWNAQRPTPALALTDLSAASWRLQEQRGRVLVINFWATWCEPCVAEFASLVQLAGRYPDGAVQVVAVNYQENEDKVRRFAAQAAVPFVVLLDRDGSATRQWTHRIFPTTVIVDAQGRARWTVTGETDWDSQAVHRLLAPLLQPAPPASKHNGPIALRATGTRPTAPPP